MKKLLVTTIVVAMIASLGAAFAQSSQSHDVQVRLPQVVMIRLTATTTGNAAVVSPSAVEFDLTTGTFEPLGTYAPTNVANWNNVRVFANGGGWQVTVAVATTTPAFDWRKVSVTPSGGDLAVAAFNLPAAGASADIVSSSVRTGGWLSLGFGPAQFALTLDGTEVADTFTTTVTYTITNH